MSHIGLVRKRNEDAFGGSSLPAPTGDGEVVFGESMTYPVLAVVADGMGGHQGGHIASRIAVQSVLDAKPEDAAALVDAVRYANEEIVAAMSDADGTVGMGSTVVAVLVHRDGIAVANVGDSPALEIIDGRLVQLTTDDVAGGGPGLPGIPSSVLTQALGGGARLQDVEVHLYEDDVAARRRLLLCSDGLTSYVPRSSIADALGMHDAEACLSELVRLALQAGGNDNITALLLDLGLGTWVGQV